MARYELQESRLTWPLLLYELSVDLFTVDPAQDIADHFTVMDETDEFEREGGITARHHGDVIRRDRIGSQRLAERPPDVHIGLKGQFRTHDRVPCVRVEAEIIFLADVRKRQSDRLEHVFPWNRARLGPENGEVIDVQEMIDGINLCSLSSTHGDRSP